MSPSASINSCGANLTSSQTEGSCAALVPSTPHCHHCQVSAENKANMMQIEKDIDRTMPNDTFIGSAEGHEVV